MPNYVISTERSTSTGSVVYELVTDRLQRLFVNIPYKRTEATSVNATIDHTITALYAAPKPLR